MASKMGKAILAHLDLAFAFILVSLSGSAAYPVPDSLSYGASDLGDVHRCAEGILVKILNSKKLVDILTTFEEHDSGGSLSADVHRLSAFCPVSDGSLVPGRPRHQNQLHRRPRGVAITSDKFFGFSDYASGETVGLMKPPCHSTTWLSTPMSTSSSSSSDPSPTWGNKRSNGVIGQNIQYINIPPWAFPSYNDSYEAPTSHNHNIYTSPTTLSSDESPSSSTKGFGHYDALSSLSLPSVGNPCDPSKTPNSDLGIPPDLSGPTSSSFLLAGPGAHTSSWTSETSLHGQSSSSSTDSFSSPSGSSSSSYFFLPGQINKAPTTTTKVIPTKTSMKAPITTTKVQTTTTSTKALTTTTNSPTTTTKVLTTTTTTKAPMTSSSATTTSISTAAPSTLASTTNSPSTRITTTTPMPTSVGSTRAHSISASSTNSTSTRITTTTPMPTSASSTRAPSTSASTTNSPSTRITTTTPTPTSASSTRAPSTSASTTNSPSTRVTTPMPTSASSTRAPSTTPSTTSSKATSTLVTQNTQTSPNTLPRTTIIVGISTGSPGTPLSATQTTASSTSPSRLLLTVTPTLVSTVAESSAKGSPTTMSASRTQQSLGSIAGQTYSTSISKVQTSANNPTVVPSNLPLIEKMSTNVPSFKGTSKMTNPAAKAKERWDDWVGNFNGFLRVKRFDRVYANPQEKDVQESSMKENQSRAVDPLRELFKVLGQRYSKIVPEACSILRSVDSQPSMSTISYLLTEAVTAGERLSYLRDSSAPLDCIAKLEQYLPQEGNAKSQLNALASVVICIIESVEEECQSTRW